MIKALSTNTSRGFTLIEVLVAVAVIGFVVPALMLLMMKQADYTGVLRDKTIANWIAQNKATELRLERVFLKRLEQREQFEQIEMAGAQWSVNVGIENTLEGALIKYEIKVSRVIDGASEPETPLVTLETYLHGT